MKLTKRKDGRYCKSKTINGERVFFYSSEQKLKNAEKDIERQMIEYKGKIEKGKLFKEVAELWEREHYPHIQAQTEHRYKSLTARLVDFFGDMRIKTIKPEYIEVFLSELVEKQFSSKTIKDELSVLKMIFKFAFNKRFITSNVSQYIQAPKGKPKQEREALTDDEIKIVENSLDKDFGLLAFFLLYTGLRKGEALALTYGDIDRDNNLIRVTKSVEYIGNKAHVKEPKTKSGYRNVPLLDRLKECLPSGSSEDIVFDDNGKYMTASFYDRHWRRYKEQTGLNVTAHQLRHTFTTLLFEWGIDEKDSQEIIGHADISTTRNIYTHVRKSRMQSTLKKMNEQMSGCCQQA